MPQAEARHGRGIPRRRTRSTPRAASWSAIATPISSSPRNSASRGCGCAWTAAPRRPGPRSRTGSSAPRAARQVERRTRETEVAVERRSVARGAEQRRHRARFLRSHARADRQARRFRARARTARATCTSTSTTPSRTARSRSARRCARRWATSAASRATASCSPMDEAEAQVALDLSGRPYFVWEGRFNRERVGDMPTELVPHFFRSLVRDAGRRAAPARARREHAPHGRVLLQGRGPERCGRRFAARAASCRAPRAAAVSARDIVIVASGGANIASLQFALERLGVAAEVSADPQRIRRASHVILPGVGAAADAMARLRSSGLDALIPSLTQPVLGICLGMQLSTRHPPRGRPRCLGRHSRARASRLAEAPGRPVPHMGWNTLEIGAAARRCSRVWAHATTPISCTATRCR